MSYNPEFMLKHEEYIMDKNKIQTKEEWISFRKKWFSSMNWPKKTPDILKKELPLRVKAGLIGNRYFSTTNYYYDITADARYEMFSAMYMIGYPRIFPNYDFAKANDEFGWYLECPYCQITTRDNLKDNICPVCKREMFLVRTTD